jgi:hypothetical protein
MDLAWCGDDAVVLYWRKVGIVMVGPYGDWLNYPYDGALHIVPEPDCCRIITGNTCEILQRVPSSTEAIRRIGSTDPAALLYDAMEGYTEGDPKSDENIRSIASANQLQQAVKSCITAAASEFDVLRQQSLLRAASYGKAFCQNMDSDDFVETALRLRVLNDVRHPSVGVPLTIQQYLRLTPEVLVNRLTLRNHHFLALKICELLKLKNERVLVHWASEKVKHLTATAASDEEITSAIKKKLEQYHRVSYLEVAAAAYYMGRRRLATMLLDMEKNAADQVPLLLSMQEEELALQKAINSEDTDLIYLALIHLERSNQDRDAFLRLVHQHPEAANLLRIYYRNKVNQNDRAILHNLLIFNKNYLEAGIAAVNQAYTQPVFARRLQLMKESVSLFGQGRDLGTFKTLTEEEMDLNEMQKALEVRSGKDFVDLSLSETLYNLYWMGIETPQEASRWETESAKIIKRFKVSEKMVYHIKVEVFCKTGSLALLQKLATEKKSPIGYKPFAAACLRY